MDDGSATGWWGLGSRLAFLCSVCGFCGKLIKRVHAKSRFWVAKRDHATAVDFCRAAIAVNAEMPSGGGPDRDLDDEWKRLVSFPRCEVYTEVNRYLARTITM